MLLICSTLRCWLCQTSFDTTCITGQWDRNIPENKEYVVVWRWGLGVKVKSVIFIDLTTISKHVLTRYFFADTDVRTHVVFV